MTSEKVSAKIKASKYDKRYRRNKENKKDERYKLSRLNRKQKAVSAFCVCDSVGRAVQEIDRASSMRPRRVLEKWHLQCHFMEE